MVRSLGDDMPLTDTRDIAVRTEAKVEALVSALNDFILEVRKDRLDVRTKLEEHEALVNKGKGARWMIWIVGGALGYIAAYLPHPKVGG